MKVRPDPKGHGGVNVHDRDDRGMIDPVTGGTVDQKDVAERLLVQVGEPGVSLVGPGGLLNQLTRNVLETALEAELTEHLGHGHGQTPIAANVRKVTRPMVIVPKRKRRLDGDQIMFSLSARGLSTGEIAAHFEEVYGTKVSKDTISRNAEKVADDLAGWSARPLDPIYQAILVDAVVVKAHDGQVRNTPFYVVMGVPVKGELTERGTGLKVLTGRVQPPTPRQPPASWCSGSSLPWLHSNAS